MVVLRKRKKVSGGKNEKKGKKAARQGSGRPVEPTAKNSMKTAKSTQARRHVREQDQSDIAEAEDEIVVLIKPGTPLCSGPNEDDEIGDDKVLLLTGFAIEEDDNDDDDDNDSDDVGIESDPAPSPSVLAWALEGFAGTGVGGSFFTGPRSLNVDVPPGQDPVKPETRLLAVLRSYLTLAFFFFSPNLVWFVVACAVWVVAPYDFELVQSDPARWLRNRAVINASLVVLFFGFWHVTLHGLQWAGQRSFYRAASARPTANKAAKAANRSREERALFAYRFPPGKLLHNVWYSCLGAAQWALVEGAFTYCYATGRLQYLAGDPILRSADRLLDLSGPDSPPAPPAATAATAATAAAAGSWDWSGSMTWGDLALFAGWCFFVVVVRDLHFYFSHRFLHHRFLYRFVHSLHHRNTTDLEPFSGLCMHPVEHLYYFTCYGPIIWAGSAAPPFAVMWTGVHLLLSPAAAHSGFEGHFSADLFHYIHHRYFVSLCIIKRAFLFFFICNSKCAPLSALMLCLFHCSSSSFFLIAGMQLRDWCDPV